jgi:hypothetical protein
MSASRDMLRLERAREFFAGAMRSSVSLACGPSATARPAELYEVIYEIFHTGLGARLPAVTSGVGDDVEGPA